MTPGPLVEKFSLFQRFPRSGRVIGANEFGGHDFPKTVASSTGLTCSQNVVTARGGGVLASVPAINEFDE
jgi:hypothetical protein